MALRAAVAPVYGDFELAFRELISPQTDFAVGLAGGVASGTEAYYSFDYANTHFIALDSHDSDRSADGRHRPTVRRAQSTA